MTHHTTRPATARSGARMLLTASLLTGSFVIGTLGGAPVAAAGTTIVVTTTADELETNGLCSLREAMTAANTDVAVNDCPAGSDVEDDTIELGDSATYVLSSTLPGLLGNIVVSGNGSTIDADGTGEALFVSDVRATIDNVTLTGGNTDEGGGIRNWGGIVTITNSTITANNATDWGGGIYNDGEITLTNSTVSGNNSNGDGGGIYNLDHPAITITVSNSTISDNTSLDSGGGISNGGTMTISNSTILDNDAVGSGGGVFNFGTTTVSNSTISGNTAAGEGGGIGNFYETVVLAFSTITDNTASTGAGIASYGDDETSTSVVASIVADNVGDDVELFSDTSDSFVSGGFNVIGSSGPDVAAFTADATSLNDADPLLGAVADHGGGTVTHALAAGSPAIDLVSAVVGGDPAVDQRGVERPYGAAKDAGAYERNVDDLDPVGRVDGEVFVSLTPARFADSRDEATVDDLFRDTGPRGGGTVWEIDVAGRGDVPSDAGAAVLNLTVLNGAAPGFAVAYPCGEVPNASSVNYAPGGFEANEVVTKLSGDGTVCVFTLASADVIVDVVGYAPDDSPYRALSPTRYADSRDESTFDNTFRNTGPRAAGTSWEIQIAGRGDVPAEATTVAANLTVTGGVGPGFATVYPCGTVPNASSLNYAPGITRPNEVIAKLSATGTICVFTLVDVDVIVDVVGYLGDVTSYTAISPTRYADSRAEATFDDMFRDTGPRPAEGVWEIDIAGRGTIPADATTVVANLTVTGGQAPGFATVYPCGTLPNASSVNYSPDITRPNEVIAKLSATGTLCVYTLAPVDVIIDISGHN